MAEIPISQEAIDSLGRQLDEVAGEEERTLLSGIIAVAAQAIHDAEIGTAGVPLVVPVSDLEPPAAVEVRQPLPSFQDQIARAFVAGALDESTSRQIDSVKIGPMVDGLDAAPPTPNPPSG